MARNPSTPAKPSTARSAYVMPSSRFAVLAHALTCDATSQTTPNRQMQQVVQRIYRKDDQRAVTARRRAAGELNDRALPFGAGPTDR